MREVLLHLSDVTYQRLAEAAAAVHKPLEQWIIDVLTTDSEDQPVRLNRTTRLRPRWMYWALSASSQRRPAGLSALLKIRKERPLTSEETSELQTLMDTANALELASLQRLTSAFGR